MRYVGGKSRIAGNIQKFVALNRGNRDRYIEPFLGGGSTFGRIAPDFAQAVAADVVPDLIMMWTQAAKGWIPPTDVNDLMYNSLRDAQPSALRGFVGFGCSFGGKWFGGLARGGKNADGTPRNHAAESSRAVVRVAQGMSHATLTQASYDFWAPGPESVVYCDPPYAGTQTYGAAGSFDSSSFWSTAEEWHHNGALVLVSEYDAPSGWVPVLEQTHRQSLQHGSAGRPRTVEKVFAYGP